MVINLLDELQSNKLDKLGFMIYGIPGCGKTSIIKSIVNYTKRYIIYINLNDINNQQHLFNIFHNDIICNEFIPMNKRIYVLEDIDCDTNIVHDRDQDIEIIKKETKVKDEQITLSNILNCLDGIIELKEIIIVMTTNHIEKLDPALIRPGRINMVLELKKLDNKSFKEIINYKYKANVKESLIKEN